MTEEGQTPWSDVMGSCEVHKRLEYDYTPREVRYCKFCDAWMCRECMGSPVRRTKAALKGT